MSDSESSFPILRGRTITNTKDLMAVMSATMADAMGGRITPKEARAINREAREILKLIRVVVRGRSLASRL
jgi:hypothetical protein